MIEILAKAIQIQTTQDVNDENMPKLHALIEESFPLVHKNMQKVVVGHSLVYKIEGEGNPILLCGHLDVVHADAKYWNTDPYGGVIKDGWLWGRGTIDCKHVVFALLFAMENLLKDGFKPKRTVYLAFGHDEEIGGDNGANQVVKMLKSQGVKLDLVLDEGGKVSSDFLPDKNYAVMSLAEKNIMRMKITAPDKGGHAAGITGKTGLYRIAKAIIAIEENPMPAKILPLIQKYIDTMSKDYPQLVENYVDNPKNSPFVRTTIAPTMTEASKMPNILPNEASVTCDIRILPGQTNEEVIEYIKGITKGLDLEYEILRKSDKQSNVTDFESYFYKEIEKLIKEEFDDAVVAPMFMAGGTDARHYEEICETVIRFMPLLADSSTNGMMHGHNEGIEIRAFEKMVDFYEKFLKRHG